MISTVTTNEDVVIVTTEADADGSLYHPGAVDNSCEADYNCNGSWVSTDLADYYYVKREFNQDFSKWYYRNDKLDTWKKVPELTWAQD